MAVQPRSRVKNIRVPTGKEREYDKDQQGNLIHTQYGEDDEVDAVVLPSAKGLDRHGTGGQHRRDFDPLGRNIPQNVIIFDDSGVPQTVTKTDGRELAQKIQRRSDRPAADGSVDPVTGAVHELTKEEADKLGEEAEYLYRGLAEERSAAQSIPEAPAEVKEAFASAAAHDAFIEEGLVAGTAKKKAKKKSRRVVKSGEGEAPAPAKQEPNYLPVEVEIDAPFGRLRQNFSGIFRDGICLVLWTDQRKLPSIYTLPVVDQPMEITIRWQDKVIPCLWAGIQFTWPHAPVTFTVLLIDEGQANGEGQQG